MSTGVSSGGESVSGGRSRLTGSFRIEAAKEKDGSDETASARFDSLYGSLFVSPASPPSAEATQYEGGEHSIKEAGDSKEHQPSRMSGETEPEMVRVEPGEGASEAPFSELRSVAQADASALTTALSFVTSAEIIEEAVDGAVAGTGTIGQVEDGKEIQPGGSMRGDTGAFVLPAGFQPEPALPTAVSPQTDPLLESAESRRVLVEGFLEELRGRMDEGLREVTVRLDPERLGEIEVRVIVRANIVEAEIVTSQASVGMALGEEFDLVRDSLFRSGLAVSRLTVLESLGGRRRRILKQFEDSSSNPSRPGRRADRRNGEGGLDLLA